MSSSIAAVIGSGVGSGVGSGTGSAAGAGSGRRGGGAEFAGAMLGSTTVRVPLWLAASASAIPVGSPTNSRRYSPMPRAVVRSWPSRDPWSAYGLTTWSQSASSGRGMSARTCRGRSTRPCSCGAAGTPELEAPGQRPVSAAYSSPPRSATSVDTRPGARPCRAASTPKPMTRMDPVRSMRTFSGTSRPWATPASWPAATEVATSETSQAARRGARGPSVASMMSSELPAPHSLTT